MSSDSAEMDAGRPVTYDAAEARYQGINTVQERFGELVTRDRHARSRAALEARGEYDPVQHGTREPEPLTAAEHLEVLALGEMLARYYRHPSRVHDAVEAGATWAQVAAARGSDEARARREYREWADGQHSLWQHYGGRLGINDAEHADAMRRAAGPDREAGQ